MTGQDIRDVLDSAGIRAVEACNIFRVSRGTLRRWFEGVEPRQQVVFDLAVRWAKLIQRAEASGLLPLSHDIVGEARLPAIKAALKQAAEPSSGKP